MDQDDPELAAEGGLRIARSVMAAEGDTERLRELPLGNTVQRLLAMRDGTVPDTDHQKLVGLASAVERAKDGDAEALEHLPDLVRDVREWFGLLD